MTALLEEQWELDGFVFGNGTNMIVLKGGLDFGAAPVRVQDVDRPQGDGSMFGRDFVGAPEWSLTLGVQHGLDVWPVLNQLAQRWRADDIRSRPGALSTLRYRRHGVTYRILGRPRKFGLIPSAKKNDRFQQVSVTFQLANPEVYVEPEDNSTRTLTLRLTQARSDGGWVWPAVFPVEVARNSQARSGQVTVGGMRPAPFKVQIHGPSGGGQLSNISISGDGWRIATANALAYDQSVLIDTATNTIGRGGVSWAGSLSRDSSLAARLQPGDQVIEFAGTDPSNTAYAVVTWLDTIPA